MFSKKKKKKEKKDFDSSFNKIWKEFDNGLDSFSKPRIINLKPNPKELERIKQIKKAGTEVNSLKDLKKASCFVNIHKVQTKDGIFYYSNSYLFIETREGTKKKQKEIYYYETTRA